MGIIDLDLYRIVEWGGTCYVVKSIVVDALDPKIGQDVLDAVCEGRFRNREEAIAGRTALHLRPGKEDAQQLVYDVLKKRSYRDIPGWASEVISSSSAVENLSVTR